jgi:hypothetical protein
MREQAGGEGGHDGTAPSWRGGNDPDAQTLPLS